jgi:hypothetical protein
VAFQPFFRKSEDESSEDESDAIIMKCWIDKKEGGKSHQDVGGRKYAVDFRLDSIRRLSIFKVFD